MEQRRQSCVILVVRYHRLVHDVEADHVAGFDRQRLARCVDQQFTEAVRFLLHFERCLSYQSEETLIVISVSKYLATTQDVVY